MKNITYVALNCVVKGTGFIPLFGFEVLMGHRIIVDVLKYKSETSIGEFCLDLLLDQLQEKIICYFADQRNNNNSISVKNAPCNN